MVVRRCGARSSIRSRRCSPQWAPVSSSCWPPRPRPTCPRTRSGPGCGRARARSCGTRSGTAVTTLRGATRCLSPPLAVNSSGRARGRGHRRRRGHMGLRGGWSPAAARTPVVGSGGLLAVRERDRRQRRHRAHAVQRSAWPARSAPGPARCARRVTGARAARARGRGARRPGRWAWRPAAGNGARCGC